MARFIGRLQGSRGQVTRLGGADGGMTAEARGWDIGVQVHAFASRQGTDVIHVMVNGGSNGAGRTITFASVRREGSEYVILISIADRCDEYRVAI